MPMAGTVHCIMTGYSRHVPMFLPGLSCSWAAQEAARFTIIFLRLVKEQLTVIIYVVYK